MVEEVEGLPLEFKSTPLVDLEALERAEVEVQPARHVKRVAPDSAEGQSGRNRVCARVVVKRPTFTRAGVGVAAGAWIADEVGTRPGANAIADAGAITKVRSVGDAERRARLRDGDARHLPAAEKCVLQSRRLGEGQCINVA